MCAICNELTGGIFRNLACNHCIPLLADPISKKYLYLKYFKSVDCSDHGLQCFCGAPQPQSGNEKAEPNRMLSPVRQSLLMCYSDKEVTSLYSLYLGPLVRKFEDEVGVCSNM
jgi:hypothetical protein